MKPLSILSALCAVSQAVCTTDCTTKPVSVVTMYTTVTAIRTHTGNNSGTLAVLSSYNGTTSTIPITGNMTNPLVTSAASSKSVVANMTTTVAAGPCTAGDLCPVLTTTINALHTSGSSEKTAQSGISATGASSAGSAATTAQISLHSATVHNTGTLMTTSSTLNKVSLSVTFTSFITSTTTLTLPAPAHSSGTITISTIIVSTGLFNPEADDHAIAVPSLTVSAVPVASPVAVQSTSGPGVVTSTITKVAPLSSSAMTAVTVTITSAPIARTTEESSVSESGSDLSLATAFNSTGLDTVLTSRDPFSFFTPPPPPHKTVPTGFGFTTINPQVTITASTNASPTKSLESSASKALYALAEKDLFYKNLFKQVILCVIVLIIAARMDP